MMYNAKTIYNSIAGARERGHITVSKFDKLAQIEGVCNEYVQKVDLALIFKSVCQQGQVLTFVEFVTALEALYEKWNPEGGTKKGFKLFVDMIASGV